MPSNRIVELREKQSQLVAEARERLDQITNETDEARAKELEEQHDAAMAEHDRIEGLLEREEELADKEARLQERRERERPLTDVSGNGVDTPDEGAEVTYRSAFAKVVCGVAPSDLTSEERQVLRQGMTKFEARTQVGSSDAAGGFTVPEELANVIIRTMKMWGPMYDEAVATEMVTGSGNPIPMPTVDDTANEAAARTEGNDVADDNSGDVTFGRKVLNAYSFNTPFIKWSWELDMDSIFNMENLLGDLLGERLGRIANRQLTTGSGSNAPNGIVTAAGAGLTAAATSALTFDEIISLEHSVDPAYRRAPKVRYMLNDNTLEAVRKLKDGQGNYLWQKGDVRAGTPDLLNGRSYSINQHMADLGASNVPLIFGDFGKYYVRKVGAPVVGVLRERFWPQVGIAGLIRFDGELGDADAVKKLTMAAV